MPHRLSEGRTLAAAAFLLLVAGVIGCTDVVYRDRPPFKAPPDAASGFLGYYAAAEGRTTCGNCHVDHQADWETHPHSQAFAALVNSGQAQSACYECHTVTERGNAVDSAAGYNKRPVAAYQDVQCESCHGPGLTHVETPDASAPPLSRADTDTLGNPASPNPKGVGTCAECHSGSHYPYVDQWRTSRHGRANSTNYNNASCVACHEGRGILKAWGVTSNYKERDNVVSDTVVAMGVTCVVCHDPHGSGLPASLRFPVTDPSIDNNLCMKCHARRFEPQVTSSRGPHAPQGPVFLGTAGWIPTGVDTTPQASTHGDATLNPRLCAGCHINRFTVTDPGGTFTLQSVGHLFRPIPCLDPATGEPLPGEDNSCGYTATERWWGDPVAKTGCLQAGCHSSVNAVVLAFDANRTSLGFFADQIWIDTNDNDNVDATDGGYLGIVKAQSPTNEFSTSDGVITVAEGALFNVRMLGEGRYDNGDKSMGVHNPFLSQKLLVVTIQALQTQYPFLPAPPAPLQQAMRQALAKAAARGAARPLAQR